MLHFAMVAARSLYYIARSPFQAGFGHIYAGSLLFNIQFWVGIEYLLK